MKSDLLSLYRKAAEIFNSFEMQIKFICDHFKVVTAGELVDLYINNNTTGYDSYCAITFDDGFASIMENAIPILDKYKIKATVFVNYKLFKLSEDNNIEALELFCKDHFPRLYQDGLDIHGLNKNHLKELISNGIEIGSHTVNHPVLARLDKDDLYYELKHPMDMFKLEFSYPIDILAYPYGRKKDINALSKQMAKEAGYKAAFTTISGSLSQKNIDYMQIPRTCVSFNWSFNYFQAVFKGAEDLRDFLQGQK